MNWYLTALKNYAVFSGRARRKEYWYFMLFSIIITYGLVFIGFAINAPYICVIYLLAAIVPAIAVGVRRMHDVDKSGWFLLIPIYNIILRFTDGTPGENQYGPDPKTRVEFGAEDYQKPFDINP